MDVTGAPAIDDEDEIEEDRDDREEVSETIDSGDDDEETELAKDDRRCITYGCGEDVYCGCHFSLACETQAFEAWAIAKLIDDVLLRM